MLFLPSVIISHGWERWVLCGLPGQGSEAFHSPISGLLSCLTPLNTDDHWILCSEWVQWKLVSFDNEFLLKPSCDAINIKCYDFSTLPTAGVVQHFSLSFCGFKIVSIIWLYRCMIDRSCWREKCRNSVSVFLGYSCSLYFRNQLLFEGVFTSL